MHTELQHLPSCNIGGVEVAGGVEFKNLGTEALRVEVARTPSCSGFPFTVPTPR